MAYQINKSIIVRYVAEGGQSGITDLQMIVTNPNEQDSSPITLNEIGTSGAYEGTFTPDKLGKWWVKITSSSEPDNVDTQSYEVTRDGRDKVDAVLNLQDNKDFAQTSAFGLLKFATESVICDLRWNSNLINDQFTVDTIANGNWSIVESNALQLNTGASSSSGITLTDNIINYYQAGKGMLFKISIILGDSGISGNVREWGMFNDNNGVFVRLDGTEYKFILRKNGVDTEIPASNWDIPITPDANGHIWYIQYQWIGVGNYFLYYDGQLVYTHQYLGTSTGVSIDSPDLPVRLKNYNDTNTSDVYLKSGASSTSIEGSIIISGKDSNNILREIGVTADGRLLISQAPSSKPPQTTGVTVVEYDIVATTHDNIYTIPTGETLHIQRFIGGGETVVDGSVIELWYDPNGDGTNMTIIDTIFIDGASDQHELDNEYIGDGTKVIRMRRKRLGGGSAELFGKWEGYY